MNTNRVNAEPNVIDLQQNELQKLIGCQTCRVLKEQAQDKHEIYLFRFQIAFVLEGEINFQNFIDTF